MKDQNPNKEQYITTARFAITLMTEGELQSFIAECQLELPRAERRDFEKKARRAIERARPEAQQAVLDKYPDADYWWDRQVEVFRIFDRVPRIDERSRGLGAGRTVDEAWVDAARKLR